jgi:TolB protein
MSGFAGALRVLSNESNQHGHAEMTMKIHSRRAVLTLLLALPLGACQDDRDVLGIDGAPDLAAARGGNGQGGGGSNGPKIAFAVLNDRIHTIDEDGSGYSALSNTEGGTDPAWSPDRRKLAFAIPTGSSAGLYVVSVRGGRRTQLHAGVVGGPAWSPDGTKIAFHATVGAETHIFVVDATGANLAQATAVGTVNSHPTWSGDGTQIAWFSNRAPTTGIWAMAANGTNRRLVKACTYCSTPTWSPVPGDPRIAYNTWYDGTIPTAAIHVVNQDGTLPYPGPDVLANSTAHGTSELHPSWSPDGTKLIFNSGTLGGGRDLVVVNADGTGLARLTVTPALEAAPAWAR